MTPNPVYKSVTFTIEESQKHWLETQANKRLSNKSVIVREAITLLKKEYENVKQEKQK